jgi:hypothetical protein
MDEHLDEYMPVDLKGCIVRWDDRLLAAQREYTDTCSMIASNQKAAMEELMSRAPECLHKVLWPALHSLFDYRQATLRLRGWNTHHSARKAAMLSELARAWKDAIEIDVEIEQKHRTHFTVHLYAISNKETT